MFHACVLSNPPRVTANCLSVSSEFPAQTGEDGERVRITPNYLDVPTAFFSTLELTKLPSVILEEGLLVAGTVWLFLKPQPRVPVHDLCPSICLGLQKSPRRATSCFPCGPDGTPSFQAQAQSPQLSFTAEVGHGRYAPIYLHLIEPQTWQEAFLTFSFALCEQQVVLTILACPPMG